MSGDGPLEPAYPAAVGAVTGISEFLVDFGASDCSALQQDLP